MIRALPMLLLSLATGCAPEIVGEWDLTAFLVNGVSAESTGSLTLEDDLEGDFEFNSDGETFTGRAEADETTHGDWALDLTIDGETLYLDCEIDADEMTCDEDTDGLHYVLEWERD